MKAWWLLIMLQVALVGSFRSGSCWKQPSGIPLSRARPLCVSSGDLQVRTLDAFAASTNNALTRVSLDEWETAAVEASSQLRQLSEGKVLYAVYTSLLKTVAPQTLDPLQLATFEMLSSAIVDSLIRLYPKGVPVTGLIDEITEAHLSFVEEFRTEIDDGGGDGYSQSTQQEFLCYQLAGLVERVYMRISKGLGADFDSSPATVRMRVSNWVSPVYARLQRRFVRFLAGNVEEKVEQSNAQAFERMLDRLIVGIEPRYSLRQLQGEVVKNQGAGTSRSLSPVYPAWELTYFITKILRNTLGCAPLASVEPQVAQRLQNDLSVKMRALGRPLERVAAKMADKSFRIAALAASKSALVPGPATPTMLGLDDKETQIMESMLEIGHVSATAVFTVWQVRHNLVGVPEDPLVGFEGKLIKEFLSPVSLSSGRANALLAIPKGLRVVAEAAVDEYERTTVGQKPSEELASAALLAHALRYTAAEEFRALITYNSDPSEWPASRDASYSAVLSSVLLQALVATGNSRDQLTFLENLVAMAALEETIGVREPRAACLVAYENALKSAALFTLSLDAGNRDASAFAARLSSVEAALGIFGRLPTGREASIRMTAFRAVVDAIMSEAPARRDSSSSSSSSSPSSVSSGLKRVEEQTPELATMFAIDAAAASAYVTPLGRAVFDRSVGSLLVSAELAGTFSGSSSSAEQTKMGEMLRAQVISLSSELGMSAQEATERTGFLAGAVFESLLETALEEYRRLSVDRAELAMLRALTLTRHPLVGAMMSDAGTGKEEGGTLSGSASAVVEMGVRMTLARLGAARLSEVVRMTEVLRGKQQGAGVGGSGSTAGGWGAVAAGGTAARDPAFGEFLALLQEKLLREYSKASLSKSSFSPRY